VDASLLPAAQLALRNVAVLLNGPPGIYSVLGSTNLSSWNVLGSLTNTLGSAAFTDLDVNGTSHKFYRAQFAR
jgi:hypothetical protein